MVKNRDRESGVYSIHQAKTQLSRLLDHVLSSGTPILIGRRGKAEAMLAPISAKANAKRAPGLYRSIIKFPENTLPESPNISTLSSSQTLLLSPQSLLRWFAAPFELSATVHQFIEEPTNGVCVSVDALRQILVWVNENKIDLGTLKGRFGGSLHKSRNRSARFRTQCNRKSRQFKWKYRRGSGRLERFYVRIKPPVKSENIKKP